MQDNFDRKLTERIVQVFDEYEDDSADQGWEQLRLKYPAPQRRSPIVYWLSSAAAILLLIAGVWLFYPGTEKIQLASREKQEETILPGDNSVPESKAHDDQASAVSSNPAEEAPLYTAERGPSAFRNLRQPFGKAGLLPYLLQLRSTVDSAAISPVAQHP